MKSPRWSHTYAQWLLLDLGRKTGHDVWIAAGDHNRVAGTVRLGDLSLRELPTALPVNTRNIMAQIDVVWFPRGTRRPRALFEVEHTTSIVTGMLRMSDLLASATPTTSGWRMAIVAPARRLSRYQSELVRPTFRATGLADVCTFVSYDELLHRHERAVNR